MKILWIVVAGYYLYAMTLAIKAYSLHDYSECLLMFAMVFGLLAAVIYKEHPSAKKIFEWF